MGLLRAFPSADQYHISGNGRWESAFAVSDLANASFAAVGLTLADLMVALNLEPTAPEVTVDQPIASLWFGNSFRPIGWDAPDLWDPIAGNYATRDGWIRLHTNLPHHRAAALGILGCRGEHDAVAAAAKNWERDALETAVVEAGGVAAAMRSRADWLAHPQGQAVAQEPLIDWISPRRVQLRERAEATSARPLAGLRVLDLTRVLAGPVCTRTLAGFGAEVLRIDPPGWDEPGVLTEISLGKRMAALDLKSDEGRARLETLLAQADVLVHGYRPGALDALGLGLARRDQIAPNRLEVTLDAYGWTGPWATRRGFDSLVQMSAGISDTGRKWQGRETPVPLPVQALDHATGYLMTGALLSAMCAAAQGQDAAIARLSLARMAEALVAQDATAAGAFLQKGGNALAKVFSIADNSAWGPALRLDPALSLGAAQMLWQQPSGPSGRHEAAWATGSQIT